MVKVEVLETSMWGCVTRSPNAGHYKKLSTQHQRFLLRCIGFRRKRDSYRVLSIAENAVSTTKRESMEISTGRRALLFTGFLVRTDESRLPKRVMAMSGQLTDWRRRCNTDCKTCFDGNCRLVRTHHQLDQSRREYKNLLRHDMAEAGAETAIIMETWRRKRVMTVANIRHARGETKKSAVETTAE